MRSRTGSVTRVVRKTTAALCVFGASLLATSCKSDAFVPVQPPLQISTDVLELHEYMALEGAMLDWFDAAPRSVESITHGVVSGCGVVVVRKKQSGKECPSLAGACVYSDGCRATLWFPAEADGELLKKGFEHELGHVLLGEEHSDVFGEIMSLPWLRDDQAAREISADEGRRVRELMK